MFQVSQKGKTFTILTPRSAANSYAVTGNHILSVKPPRIGNPPDGRALLARTGSRLPPIQRHNLPFHLAQIVRQKGIPAPNERRAGKGSRGRAALKSGSNQLSASPGRLLWFLSCRSKKGTPPAGLTSETFAETEPKPETPRQGAAVRPSKRLNPNRKRPTYPNKNGWITKSKVIQPNGLYRRFGKALFFNIRPASGRKSPPPVPLRPGFWGRSAPAGSGCPGSSAPGSAAPAERGRQ